MVEVCVIQVQTLVLIYLINLNFLHSLNALKLLTPAVCCKYLSFLKSLLMMHHLIGAMLPEQLLKKLIIFSHDL